LRISVALLTVAFTGKGVYFKKYKLGKSSG
jgi:hypothetical protein